MISLHLKHPKNIVTFKDYLRWVLCISTGQSKSTPPCLDTELQYLTVDYLYFLLSFVGVIQRTFGSNNCSVGCYHYTQWFTSIFLPASKTGGNNIYYRNKVIKMLKIVNWTSASSTHSKNVFLLNGKWISRSKLRSYYFSYSVRAERLARVWGVIYSNNTFN